MKISQSIYVLVVGQTPPPVHGQAVMIERLLRGRYASVRLFHVRMAFSDSIGDVGRFRLGKIFHLLSVIVRIAYSRIVHRTSVLYYPPAGPNRVPLYRDLAILLCTRWMFPFTVFHLHASGMADMYPRLPAGIQFLFRRALFHADAVIRITRCHSADALLLQARHNYVIPNGIEDDYLEFGNATRSVLVHEPAEPSPPLQILFVGALRESKGVSILIEACGMLAVRIVPFELSLVGEFHLREFEEHIRKRIAELGLVQQVHFLGVLQGAAKGAAFARADVLCLPTHYESETFPTVLLEAMSFALPVVATRWRGIPDIVDPGTNGYLIDIRDASAIAQRLEELHVDPRLRHRLGQAGREKFLREFTAARHLERMEQVFVEVAAAHATPKTAIGSAMVEGDSAC
jgi:glycosyltransferase involved in cell wall biosynthesis